jgi:hypothetical protein
MSEEKLYKKVPKFVEDSHKGCKGHGNFMLDCEYEHKADRDLLCNVLDARIKQNEKDIAKSEKLARIRA